MDNVYKGCPAKMADARFLTDYRQSTTREQYIKTINNFSRDEDYRQFLQQNADQILDKEWDYLKSKNTCSVQVCIHSLPTQATHGSNNTELKLYNNVRTGKLKQNDDGYPTCPNFPDYRITHTNNAKY